jgi:uncharacterized protein (UPF0332 family)
MNRPKGRDNACNSADARARLDDARRFLEAAEKLTEPGNGDVVATNAIHSAIASADALCCVALGRRSDDGSHTAAVGLLTQVDKSLAAKLRRALDHKQQAGYESRDLSDADAATCVTQAQKLYSAAQDAVLKSGV